MSQHTWDPNGGHLVAVEDVAAWLTDTGLEHLTISGGEPMDQPGPLAELVHAVRVESDWLVTIYTGYRHEQLVKRNDPAIDRLLGATDLLIDGRYREDLHVDALWRGSSNQRLIPLSGRIQPPTSGSAGLEARVDRDGSVTVIGVPPEPGINERLVRIGPRSVNDGPTAASLPFPIIQE